MEDKYQEGVSNYEIEKILSDRKDLKARKKVVTYYKALLTNIVEELDEKIVPGENETINALLEQLEQDVKCDVEQSEHFENLDKKNLRLELLVVLYDKIKSRINKIVKREGSLHEIENDMVGNTLFESSYITKNKLNDQKWQHAINKTPNKQQIEQLKEAYPLTVVDKFLKLLLSQKEAIAKRLQERNKEIVAELKYQVRKEHEKGKRMLYNIQLASNRTNEILKAVKQAYSKKTEVEERNAAKVNPPKSNRSKLHDQMRAALFPTRKSAKSKPAKGKSSLEVNEKQGTSLKATQMNIKKIEERNIQIMKNIAQLNDDIENQVEKIQQVQNHENVGGVASTRM